MLGMQLIKDGSKLNFKTLNFKVLFQCLKNLPKSRYWKLEGFTFRVFLELKDFPKCLEYVSKLLTK